MQLTPEFKRVRARLGGFAVHHKRPELAKQAGRKGGESTSGRHPLGPRGWGVAMAMKRWHSKPVSRSESRAPKAGSGSERGGTLEPDPAPARRRLQRRPRKRVLPEQTRLL